MTLFPEIRRNVQSSSFARTASSKIVVAVVEKELTAVDCYWVYSLAGNAEEENVQKRKTSRARDEAVICVVIQCG